MTGNINYEKYKPYLKDYLRIKGIALKEDGERSFCCCVFHDEKTPSMQINDDRFHCFGCNQSGDIIDCAKQLEGFTDDIETVNFLENLFFNGSVEIKKYVKKEQKEIEYPIELVKRFNDFLAVGTHEKLVRTFFDNRKKYLPAQSPAYPITTVKFLTQYFGFFPGKTEALKVFTEEELDKLGIKNMYSSALTLELKKGWRFHVFKSGGKKYSGKDKNGNIIERNGKFGSKGAHIFPPAYPVDFTKPIILTEGELDALMLRSAGFDNAFSAMGTSGISDKNADFFKEAKEITILFDNDTAGKEGAEKVADILQKHSQATIKIARVSEIAPHKDADEAILWGNVNGVKKAIQNAKATTATKEIESNGILSAREISSLLKNIKKEYLGEEDLKRFTEALLYASESVEKTKVDLIEWGISSIPELTVIPNLQDILKVAKNFNLPRTTIWRLAKKIPSEAIAPNSVLDKKSLFFIDINAEVEREVYGEDFSVNTVKERIRDTSDFQALLKAKRPIKEAARLIAFFAKDELLWNKEEKQFYFFDGLVWNYRPDVTDIAYFAFKEMLSQYFESNFSVMDRMTVLGDFDFDEKVMKVVAQEISIHRKRVSFDDCAIKETLTLQDGVIDFSGSEVVFRDARPEEYRMAKLPYTVEQVKNGTTPKKFLEFMNGNFDNKDTLNSLLYYLSTIPSRNATFKIGGIFTGLPHTGKTTTIELISKIYTGMTAQIPRTTIMKSRYGNNDSGPNPYIAQLEGKGLGIMSEIEKNDQLNSAIFKQLTGGDTIAARGMYKEPHSFTPTAQVVILTNYSPLFDSSDQAVVDRLFIVQFSKQHEKGAEGTVEQDDWEKILRSEFPAIVKMFAEKYIELKTKYNKKIPLSLETEAYKKDYLEKLDENGLQAFVKNYFRFEKGSGKFTVLSDIYKRYCIFKNIELDEFGKPKNAEDLTQNKVTKYLKRDYVEFKVVMKRVNGYPTQIVPDLVLKDWNEVPEMNINTNVQQSQPNTQQFQNPVQTNYQNYQDFEENPFEGMTPAK